MHIATTEIDVRYSETDQMGVVYHANYLVWMEIGRTTFMADLGLQYAQLEEDGILAPVLDVQISYKKPCKYGETVLVKTWIEKYDGLRIVYGYEVIKPSGEIAVTATSSHVCVKKENFRPVAIKRTHPELHKAYEDAAKK